MSKTATLLLFFYALKEFFGQDQIDGRTKMQKIIYLTSRRNPIMDYHFKGYHYGPYSKELQNTLDRMTAFNLLEENIEYFGVGLKYFYQLTGEGIQKGREMWEKMGSPQIARLIKASKEGSTYNLLTLDELLPEAYEVAESEGIL